MIRKNLIFILALIIVVNISGQDEINFPIAVDKVYIAGNKLTKEYIILREIPFTFPDTLKEEDLLLIQKRIQNLFLFNRVELQLTQHDDKTIMIIIVTESWYFFPVPILIINERDWSKISYGLRVIHYNFRGRNEKLSIGGWFGYNPAYFVKYHNPWIGSKMRIIMGIGLSKNKVSNKIFNFDEDHLNFNFTIGRRHNLNLETLFHFTFRRIKLPDPYHIYTISGSGVDLVPTLSYQIRWDKRDLYEYPRNGFFLDYIINRTGFKTDQPQFWRFSFDNRIYFPIYRKISFAARQLFLFNEGDLPIYDRVFLGYSERIRGHYNRVLPNPIDFESYPSPQISLSSSEIRFPILPVRYYSWKNAPFFRDLYQNLKFGISAGIFMDSGIVWQHKQQFALSNFYTGFGAGVHIHLPYINIMRFDYAFDERGRGEYIIDMGVSF